MIFMIEWESDPLKGLATRCLIAPREARTKMTPSYTRMGILTQKEA